MYTYRWVSLLVWLYFIEGVVRATSDARPVGAARRWSRCCCACCSSPPAPRTCAGGCARAAWRHGVTLEATLRGIVGAAHVLRGGDLSAYELDWRKRYHGRALAVVRPGSTAEVAAVVRACAAAGVAIVPQGGNTGLVGARCPMPAARRCC